MGVEYARLKCAAIGAKSVGAEAPPTTYLAVFVGGASAPTLSSQPRESGF
ncbi:DUF6053 domain-containing protein [Lysobacter sp. TAB13]